MYVKTTERIERMFRSLDIFLVKLSFVGVLIPPLLNTAVNYFVYDMGDESFLMPRPMMCEEKKRFYFIDWNVNQKLIFASFWRLPFNWKTPVGYLVAWIFQSIGFFYTLYQSPSWIGMYFGSCWLFVSFAKDIANDFPQLNATKAERRSYCELKGRFCRIVQFHSDMKELSGIDSFERKKNGIMKFCSHYSFI